MHVRAYLSVGGHEGLRCHRLDFIESVEIGLNIVNKAYLIFLKRRGA